MADIEKMAAAFRKSGLRVYSMSSIENGTATDYKFTEDCNCRNVYSVSKAFTAAAVGMLCDDKLVTPETTFLDIFGEKPFINKNSAWKDVTVDNALTQKSGLNFNPVDLDRPEFDKYGTDDYLSIIFGLPTTGVRGETYCYTDSNYYLLSRAFTEITSKNMCDFLLDRLFNPLGFYELAWGVCPKGYSLGASGAYLRCEDFVKLGQLYLDGGIWQNNRLLSKEWVDVSLERGYAFTPLFPEKRGYQKTGAHGQKLYFSFDDKLSLAITAYDNATAVGDVMTAYL